MHIVLVHIQVRRDAIDSFIQATLANARNSLLEPGIIRFDFLQQVDHPERFSLLEVYKSPEDQLKHREAPHYLTWRDAVADMMAEPRQGIRYQNVFPPDADWKK